MASLIIFLLYSGFIFFAGYNWRRLRHDYSRLSQTSGPAPAREAMWEGILRKL